MGLAAAAGIGAVASIGGSMLASSAQSKASKSAAKSAQQASDAEIALRREQYASDTANFQPYLAGGEAGRARLQDMLGLNSSFSGIPGYTAPPAWAEANQSRVNPMGVSAPMAFGSQMRQANLTPGQRLNSGVSYGALTSALGPYTGPRTSATPQYGEMTSRMNPNQGLTSGMIGTALNPGSLTDFTKSTGYDYRVNEGAKALNLGAAREGSFQSGAADKAMMEFGQNIASNERQNYLGELDRYVRYNDAFAQNERSNDNALSSYMDTFGRGERQFGQDQGRYNDAFGADERAYGDMRGQYSDSFNRDERGYRDSLAQYGDQYEQNERGYGDSRDDYNRGFAMNQDQYMDSYLRDERGYMDNREDYARQYQTGMGQYFDQYDQNERGYRDTREDYDRAYEDDAMNDYLDRLYAQQGVGAGAASSLAGVGANFVNGVSGARNNAAQIAGQAALQRGAAQANMYGGIASGIGSALGAYQQYQYAKPAATTAPIGGYTTAFGSYPWG